MNKTIQTIKKLALLAFMLPLFIVSCSSDDSNPPAPNPDPVTPRGTYDNGLFVLNEGNSNPATASITFISNDGRVEQDIFRIEQTSSFIHFICVHISI